MESKRYITALRQIGEVCRLISDIGYDAADLCCRIARRPDRHGTAKISFRFWLFSGLAIAVCVDIFCSATLQFRSEGTTAFYTSPLIAVRIYRLRLSGKLQHGRYSTTGKHRGLPKEPVRFLWFQWSSLLPLLASSGSQQLIIFFSFSADISLFLCMPIPNYPLYLNRLCLIAELPLSTTSRTSGRDDNDKVHTDNCYTGPFLIDSNQNRQGTGVLLPPLVKLCLLKPCRRVFCILKE